MAQIAPYTTDTATTFQLTSMNGAATPATQTIRAFVINGSNSANTNWFTAGTNGGLFGTPTFSNGYATGTFNTWSSISQSGSPATGGVSVTWRMNTFSNVLTFEPTTAGQTFWLAFVFDDASTAYTWDDTNWTVALLGSTQNALVGLSMYWGRNCSHVSGSQIGNTNGVVTSNGFQYDVFSPNLQPNNAFNWVITGAGSPNVAISNYGTASLNWNGCSIRTGTGTARTDLHLVFPFTANIRNLTIFNQGSIAVPNATVAAQAGTIDGLSILRGTLCPGNPLTAGNVVPTRLITGSTSAFGDRAQPLSAIQTTDYTSLANAGGAQLNPSWRSNRLNLRAQGAGGRSTIPQLFNGWQFIDTTNNNPITTAYVNFYTTPATQPRLVNNVTAIAFHMYQVNYPGMTATNIATYDVCYQARYLASPANPDGSVKINTLVSITDGTIANASRTRYIAQYGITSGLMTRVYPTAGQLSANQPQTYLITGLNQAVLGSALYMYGLGDTTQTADNFAVFTPAYTNSNTLSPATGGNITYDPTPSHVIFFDKWGSRLATRTQVAQNSQLTTTYQVVLPEDAYIKLPDNTSGVHTNRLAAQNLNVTFTQTGGTNTSISAITIGSAMDSNDFYSACEAWSRNINSLGYLRPVGEWGDPNTLAGLLAFLPNVTTLTVNGAIGLWTPTAGKAAIALIQLTSPAGTITFAAGTVAGTMAPVSANTVNVAGQTIVNGSVSATNAITNLVSNGTVVNGTAALNFGTSSSMTMTGNLTFNMAAGSSLTGNLALTPGVAGRTIAFFGATAANLSGFVLTNTTPGTTIGLTGWPIAVPAGFTSDLNAQITVNFTNPLSSIADLKVVECYLDSNTTTTDIGTASLANAGATAIWTFVRSVASTMNIVVFAERNRPVAGRTSAQALTLTAAAEDNVDFAPSGTQPTNFTTFVNGTSVTQTTWTVGTSRSGIAFGFTVIAYDPLTVIYAKYTIRRIMENANATTIAWRRNLALGTNQIPQNVFTFTPVGTTLVGTSFYVKGAKQSINSATPVQLELWNTDSGQTLSVDWNQDITDGNQRVIYAILSPGAQAAVTSYQLALFAEASRQAGLPIDNILSNRINQASLLIPSDTTPIT